MSGRGAIGARSLDVEPQKVLNPREPQAIAGFVETTVTVGALRLGCRTARWDLDVESPLLARSLVL